MKKIKLIIYLILFSKLIFAQVEIGTVKPVGQNESFLMHVYNNKVDKSNLFFNIKTQEFVLIDKDLKTILTKKTNNNAYLGYAKIDKNTINLLFLENKSNQNSLFHQTCNLSTLELHNDKEFLSNVNTVDITMSTFTSSIEFIVRDSPDSTKTLILHTKEKTSKLIYECIILNSKLHEIQRYTVELPLDTNVMDFYVDNQGNVILLTKQYINSKIKENVVKKVNNVKYTIIGIYELGKKIVSHTYNFSNQFINEINLKIYPDNSIFVCGFYGLEYKQLYGTDLINGFFYSKLEKGTFTEIFNNKLLFNKEFVLKGMNEKVKTEYDKKDEIAKSQVMKFDIDEISIMPDNSVFISGDQKYTVYSSNLKSSNTFSGNIFITYINSKGENVWYNQILKDQGVLTFSYLESYKCFIKNNKLFFYYNDESSNLAISNAEVKRAVLSYKQSDNLSLMEVVVDKTGIVSKKSIYNYPNKLMFSPRYCWQNNENEILSYFFELGSFSSNYCLGKINLNVTKK